MPTETTTIYRRRLRINGQVQGVGFRPFVYRLATGMNLAGWVINDARGVTIEVEGPSALLEEFARRLMDELPPLASISRFQQEDVPAASAPQPLFEIRHSEGGELTDAQVTVDTAVCADCLREMRDPADPRYRYPFINCTNCGPRYSIITAIPYDRPNTTMADFEMCPLCRREYEDPLCRRFHAQPIACPTCGPGIWLTDRRGVKVEAGDTIAEAARLLEQGKILAIKGLGGFHLACRADDEHAVMRLRRRKRRDAKPFALMVADLSVARQICEMTDEAAVLLSGSLRPIVILPAHNFVVQASSPADPENAHNVQARRLHHKTATIPPPLRIAASVAQGLNTLGIMLPYTPLHYLLFDEPALAGLPLVMTSGNYSEEPLVKDNDAAIAHMGHLADYLLLHNRRIQRRVDDSVVQLSGDNRLISLRRARGYAPQPVQLAGLNLPNLAAARHAILAVGGELKSAVCLLKGDRAVLSEHIGDLKDGRVYRHYIDTINHLEKLFDVRADVLAADMHPQYLSTQYALKRAGGGGIIRVQHHHAHIAACLAENGVDAPVIGLACDGTGYGEDGAVWGCEIMEASLAAYRRLGHLRYVPLPGGDLAASQTLRPAIAVLLDAFGTELDDALGRCRVAGDSEEFRAVREQLEHNVNCPPSSSLGRWFDAVAGLAGVARANDFEGQAPMLLESAIQNGIGAEYAFDIMDGDAAGAFQIDLRPMTRQIVRDLANGQAKGVIAAKFHNTAGAMLLASAKLARRKTRLETVALSGGCFANRYLTVRLVGMLEREGFRVLRHQTVPCTDACVALGQAVVAAARVER